VFKAVNEVNGPIMCHVPPTSISNLSTNELHYRKDIVGMRGIACLFVIFNHFKIPGFTGGFIGVDIFLVISGYLITKMLVKIVDDTHTHNKNVLQLYFDFLMKRFQRIFPAALWVIILTIFGAQFLLNSFDNKNVRIDGFFAALMSGNLHFAEIGTDYFQSTRSDSYFLHYWSLSVEWQFYLIYGLFFTFVLKKVKSQRLLIISNFTLLVLSLLYLFNHQESTEMYFSTFARSWELLLGSQILLLAPYLSKILKFKSSIYIDVTTLIMLGGSVFFISEETWFFGALAACVFSFLLLTNLFELKVLRTILNLRILQHLGKISFSLYLIHWPVWLFVSDALALGLIKKTIMALFLTYALAWLTFQVFEKPFIKAYSTHKGALGVPFQKVVPLLKFLAYVTLFLQVLVITYFGINQIFSLRQSISSSSPTETFKTPLEEFSKREWVRGIDYGLSLRTLPNNLDPSISRLDEDGYLKVFNVDCLTSKGYKSPECSIGKKAPENRRLVIVGDSHAYSFLPAIQNAFDLNLWSVSLLVKANCGFALEGFGSNPKQCLQHRQWVFEELKRIKPDLILIHDSGTRKDVFRWRLSMTNAVAELPADVPVIYLSPLPTLPDLHTCLKASSNLIVECTTKVDSNLRNIRLSAIDLFQDRNAIVLDSVPWVCHQERCPPIINSKIVSVDGGHITPAFARSLSPVFFSEIKDFLRLNNLN